MACYKSNNYGSKKKKKNYAHVTWLHESFKHVGDFTLIFLAYRFWVCFCNGLKALPLIVSVCQRMRSPLPIWPGASLTSADLIESTTWVKFKQAETALPWQPHYFTLRTHFTMRCDFGLDKWGKWMKSNKWVHFGRLLLKCSGWKHSKCYTYFKGEPNKLSFCYFVQVNVNAFWLRVFPCLLSAVMEWHSMPFSLLNGFFIKALWIQPALSLKPHTLLRDEEICQWNLSLQTSLLAVSRPNNGAFIPSTAQQTRKAFLCQTTRSEIRPYNVLHYVYNTYATFIA